MRICPYSFKLSAWPGADAQQLSFVARIAMSIHTTSLILLSHVSIQPASVKAEQFWTFSKLLDSHWESGKTTGPGREHIHVRFCIGYQWSREALVPPLSHILGSPGAPSSEVLHSGELAYLWPQLFCMEMRVRRPLYPFQGSLGTPVNMPPRRAGWQIWPREARHWVTEPPMSSRNQWAHQALCTAWENSSTYPMHEVQFSNKASCCDKEQIENTKNY